MFAGLRLPCTATAVVLFSGVLCLEVGAVAGGEKKAVPPADLRLRIPPGRRLRYRWSIETTSTQKGTLKKRAFTLESTQRTAMTLYLTGAKPAAKEKTVVLMRYGKVSSHTVKRIGKEARSEVHIADGRVLAKENGKVVVDSENDVGLEKIPGYWEKVRRMERARARLVLDAAGRTVNVSGDQVLTAQLKSGGAQNLFPLLSGKVTAAGKTWEAAQEQSKIGELTVRKPILMCWEMTFRRWVKRRGKKAAEIGIAMAWGNDELEGSAREGRLKVKLSNVKAVGSGVCFFDPATGTWLDGELDYRIECVLREVKPKGEKAESLTVALRSVTSFSLSDEGNHKKQQPVWVKKKPAPVSKQPLSEK